jgi:hypothetical protein
VRYETLKRLILLAGIAANFFIGPDANAQDLNSAIHYSTLTPPDARFELLQSALVARLTLLVDKNSGDVFQIVRTRNNEFAWEKIYRVKSKIAAKHTYLLNIHTGQTWLLTEDKKEGLFWVPIWDPMHVPASSPPGAAMGGQPAAGTAPSDTRDESSNSNIIRNWPGRKGDRD